MMIVMASQVCCLSIDALVSTVGLGDGTRLPMVANPLEWDLDLETADQGAALPLEARSV
jgi:hypothetical protein